MTRAEQCRQDTAACVANEALKLASLGWTIAHLVDHADTSGQDALDAIGYLADLIEEHAKRLAYDFDKEDRA